MIKPKYLILAFVCFFLISTIHLTQADDSVIISGPITGQTYDSNKIMMYADVSNINASVYWHTQYTTETPMSKMDITRYYTELDMATFNEGILLIIVKSTDGTTEAYANLTVNINHSISNPTPTPTPTPESLKEMKITGITNSQKITGNETRMIYVTENGTDQPVEVANIFIMEDATTLSNAFTTSVSGRAKIEWVDYDDQPLPNDIYFFKVEKIGYKTIEYDIRIAISEQEEDKPELIIWGLDRKYNTDATDSDIVRVKGSDTDKYLQDVVIKIITGSGVPVTDNMITNEYGTIDFKTSGIASGGYSVVFEHPDYETKLQDITISYVPTPTPTPPTEFIWNGITFPIPHTVTLRSGTVKSYSTSSGFDADFTKDNNGATVERVKATPTPTPAPTIQANSTGVPTETPTIKAGWLLLAIVVIGAVLRTAYKNYSQINPASGGISGLISGITNRNKQDNSFIPEQANKPDLDVGMSTLPSMEDMEVVKEAINAEVLGTEPEPEHEQEVTPNGE